MSPLRRSILLVVHLLLAVSFVSCTPTSSSGSAGNGNGNGAANGVRSSSSGDDEFNEVLIGAVINSLKGPSMLFKQRFCRACYETAIGLEAKHNDDSRFRGIREIDTGEEELLQLLQSLGLSLEENLEVVARIDYDQLYLPLSQVPPECSKLLTTYLAINLQRLLNTSRSRSGSLLGQIPDKIRATAVERWMEEVNNDPNDEYNCEGGFGESAAWLPFFS